VAVSYLLQLMLLLTTRDQIFSLITHVVVFVFTFLGLNSSMCNHKSMCIFRNLSMNPIVAIEPGAFRGLTDLERL